MVPVMENIRINNNPTIYGIFESYRSSNVLADLDELVDQLVQLAGLSIRVEGHLGIVSLSIGSRVNQQLGVVPEAVACPAGAILVRVLLVTEAVKLQMYKKLS